jgi:hypothetical protein
MADRVILHIGLQKSGTTYLQKVLQECGDAVDAGGITYPLPGGRRRRREVESHEWATYGLLGTEFPWVKQRRADAERDNWKWLLRQVRRSTRPVLLSAEALSVIRTPAIQRLLDALDAPRVDIVITARGLGRTLPSLWQQHVRNGRRTSFDSYLGGLAQQRERSADDIENAPDLDRWRAFALGGLVRRWVKAVGLDRVQLITTGGGPPRVLWSRFVHAIGAPALEETPPWNLLDLRTHSGLTAPETQVMMSLNSALAEAEWNGQASGELRDWIVTRGFQARPDRGTRIVIPLDWRERVAQWSTEDIADLDSTGVSIVGDVADLAYRPDPEPERPVPRDEIALAGAAAIMAVAERS